LARRGQIVDVFAQALAPYIGASMAGASLRGHCDKLGLGDGELTAQQTEALFDAIRPGLHVFVGEERTASVEREIRQALAQMRRQP
jgi:hypothetical protein